ncbi:type II/IV secretion system ATPase subunit [Halostella salina]|uniref:type II/IV secretion system ATPase subunit n=1 Tax=Halostella salina TaxID=1547897 RepID=UPI000EF7C0A6|nr:type II/IV secretion system ATPase subunit [Halostella salina]
MRGIFDRFRADDERPCGCRPSFEDDRLVVDADGCPGDGRLADEPDCRETVVTALTDRDAETVLTRNRGVERTYEDEAAALLVAAGRFAERVAFRDGTLAEQVRPDPLRTARDAGARASPVSDIAAETGLLELAESVDGYEDALRPAVGVAIAGSRVRSRPPSDARLDDVSDLDTGSTARIYARPADALRTYHLVPVEEDLSPDATGTLVDAHEALATGAVEGGDRAPGRAVRRVAEEDDPVRRLTDVLRKHARGFGVLEDCFADPRVSDVYATAPVTANPLRVVVDGETMRTNVRLTEDGVAALASRFRRTSGRGFSRAEPTLDAAAETATGGRIRVAGVTDPVSDGVAFAFRAGGEDAFTLPALVANGTLPADAAGLLSLAVERGASVLVAGARGAGKTTTLGALLWEYPAQTRIVAIEDTPELPTAALCSAGRDVQPVRTTLDDGPGITPTEALRTALRLGEGGLVLGEVRGEEAQVLYEAMRVGANGSAVLGTIHGDGGESVRERVVSDLSVPESAFATTDLVVTLDAYERDGDRARRVSAIEEVVDRDGGAGFDALYALDGDDPARTGRIDRGESHLVAELADAGETYADVRDRLATRTELLAGLAADERTRPEDVTRAYAVEKC